MKKPIISVFLATKNERETLGKAIESVLSQSFKNFELLIYNDGGRMRLYHHIADKRVRIFRALENKGKAHAMNYLLKKARGEFIAYIDDDDLWYPNHLKILLQTFNDNPSIGAAYSDLYACYFNSEGKVTRKQVNVSRDYCREAVWVFNPILHVSLMHKKDLAQLVGGYNESLKSFIDWDIVRKLSFVTSFKHVEKVTGEYYLPENNEGSDRISFQQLPNKEKALRIIRSTMPPLEIWSNEIKKILIIASKNSQTDFISKFPHPHHVVYINTKKLDFNWLTNQPYDFFFLFEEETKLSNQSSLSLLEGIDKFGTPISLERSILVKKSEILLLMRKEGFKINALTPGTPSYFRVDVALEKSIREAAKKDWKSAYNIIAPFLKSRPNSPSIQIILNCIIEPMIHIGKIRKLKKLLRKQLSKGYFGDNLEILKMLERKENEKTNYPSINQRY